MLETQKYVLGIPLKKIRLRQGSLKTHNLLILLTVIQTTRLEEIENALLCPHYNNDSKHVNGQIDNNGLKIMMNYMVNKIKLV